MKKINYFLILERRLGDYIIIDINELDICDTVVTNDIAAIDFFTSRFAENVIRDSIERSNMASAPYLSGALKIISDAKHNLRVLTQEIFQDIVEFQNSMEILERDFKNRLFGVYKKVVESTFEDKDFIKGMLDRFKDILKTDDKRAIFKIIEELPYDRNRLIYFVIYDEISRRKQDMLRKLEKLDDAA